MTAADLMPRVEQGARWLDAHKPGWFAGINTQALDLQNCDLCVLGQLFDGYSSNASPAMELFVFNWMGERELVVNHRSEWAVEHGFNLPDGAVWSCATDGAWSVVLSPSWGILRDCWITAILERQFKQAEQDDLAARVEAGGVPC